MAKKLANEHGVARFRRLALELPATVEGAHMGHADFRIVRGKTTRIFATLSQIERGCGVLILTPEQQAEFCAELPEVFEPVPGGWGRGGATMVHLDVADDETMRGALRTAYADKAAKLGVS